MTEAIIWLVLWFVFAWAGAYALILGGAIALGVITDSEGGAFLGGVIGWVLGVAWWVFSIIHVILQIVSIIELATK